MEGIIRMKHNDVAKLEIEEFCRLEPTKPKASISKASHSKFEMEGR